jgi:hypothetical protein
LRTNQHVYGERSFWVKGREAELIRERMLRVIIRPGDRSDREAAPKQWLPLFEPIPVYCITIPGDQEKKIAAIFAPDDGTTVKIVRRTVTRLGDIMDQDLSYATGVAVPVTAVDVLEYLENELAPGKEFTPDTVMTIYWFDYLADETPASD